MQENKNLVQEALIQMKNVEEAIAENAKGILASTMKEEINQLVKESLSEQDEVDLDVDMTNDEFGMDTDNEDEVEMDVELPDMDSDEEPIDLTDASDEEILKVFKAMGENDGIIVTKDGEDIHLKDNGSDNEYLIKLTEQEEADEQEEMDEQEEEMDEQEEEMDEQSDIDAIIDQLFSKDSSDNTEMDVDMETDMDSDMEGMDVNVDADMEVGDEEVVYEIEFSEDEDEDESDDEDEEEEMDEQEEEMDEQEEEMDEEEHDEQEEMDEDDSETMDESYNPKKAKKPVGVGIGNGPKFSYKKTSGGFNEKKKEGPKSVGTGKAKFEFKKGENMEGKVKKVETKEAYGSKKHEFKRKKVDGVEKKAGDVKGHYKDYEKTETKEAARTYGMGSKEGRGLRKGITNNRNYVYGKNGVKVESVEAEVSMLREKNEEYRKALNIFRDKLNEVAIFNSNLAYATRLFTEHSTTKKEKINILRRFDSVETLKESKNLYKAIKDELANVDTKPITESVENKLNNTVSSGSAVSLIESKTYENPQFMRMKDLMSKIR